MTVPTGRLHLGHYFGTIVERVRLQNLGVHTNIIIADYQVITDGNTTEHIANNVYNMVIDYLACGIDPEKTMIFTLCSSALNQLMLPLACTGPSYIEIQPLRQSRKHLAMLSGLLLTYLCTKHATFYSAKEILFLLVALTASREITSKIARL